MKRTAFLIRFFRVVPPVPAVMLAAFAGSVVAAAVALGLRASDGYGVLAPVFLLQALAASSGFAVPARRGHYDRLLTSGVSRLGVGVGHLTASIVPGVCSWILIAAIEGVSMRGFPVVALSSGTVAGLVIVSGISWAVTVPFPRLTMGIGWLLMLAAPIDHEMVPAAARALVLPWTLVGTDLFAQGLLVVVATAVVVIGAVSCALAWICRTDLSLQVAR